MCDLSNRAEQRAERLFYTYMGTLRARAMSTELLSSLYENWEGESSLRDIPVSIIKAELDHRGVTVATKWIQE